MEDWVALPREAYDVLAIVPPRDGGSSTIVYGLYTLLVGFGIRQSRRQKVLFHFAVFDTLQL